MPEFQFRRLKKHQVGGTKEQMELRVPLPSSPTGKIYRWCPNENCTPRLFLLGVAQDQTVLDRSQSRRVPRSKGTTCPYCGTDADDDEFNYDGDIEAIQTYIEWAFLQDVNNHFAVMATDFNRSQPRGSLMSIKMDFKPDHTPEPSVWREDLIRNLACDICNRQYGVYAIALFCPDCGGHNLHIHFEREIELILQQIDLAEHVTENGSRELAYRILGNAHEDVLTAFETYQKTVYKYLIGRWLPVNEAEQLITKRAIGNRFQNVDRAKSLYANLSVDPFNVLTADELTLMRSNIEKRHIIGHNLSMTDEAYSYAEECDLPGTTVVILADQVFEFAATAKKVVLELERLI